MPVKEIGCGWCCRDIDPGELAKVPKERTFFNVVETNGPRYRSTHVCDLAGVGKERATGRAKLKKHASQKPGYPVAFCKTFRPPPRRVALRLLRLVPRTSGPRCPLPELLYAAFEVNVHLLLLRLSLSELPMGNMSEIWLSSVCAIRINKTVISIRSCYTNSVSSNRNDYVS